MTKNSKSPTIKTLYINTRDSPCNGVENISIIVQKRRLHHHKKRNRVNEAINQIIGVPISSSIIRKVSGKLSKRSSMPEFTKVFTKVKSKGSTSETNINKAHNPYRSKYFVNVSECRQSECLNPFNNPIANVKWRVYRCQLSTQDDSCCCSCNSDAMFEVMKSLYDCYKKKNCDHCNCILCGHLPREERKLGELRKSGTALSTVGIGTEKQKAEMAKKSEKTKKAEKEMVGKSAAEKEKILKELAISGAPLPEGKTASEKELINKVRADVGLPPEPKTASEKEKMKKAEAAGLIVPLEGKSAAEKEKILQNQAKAGIPLAEGRTASEKAIIQKIKATAGLPSKGVQSEKLRKAKAAGYLTPLEGKTPEQKEKILKGLAISGVPLPEGKTASEKKLIDKVRTEVGLPPEPKTSAEKKKYQQALASGIVTPLEGKSKAQKEKILKSQAEAGLPLPEGRTSSEKALIAKVKAERVRAPSAVGVPSEKLRKAKAAGFLTPLEGKTPEQKEKILRGLAISGVPLPEGKTVSEKKIIDKVRTEVGLPPEPKTSAEKKKYQQALASGIITPLEGKSKAQKEKILKSQAEAGLPLPEGRTLSEKALIAKVRATTKPPSEGVPSRKAAASPSERLRKAKAAGLITPLEGKSPEQKEKILRGLAMQGVPLPEGKTASEKKLVDKVRNDVGLPPEPKVAAEKEKYKKALAAGIITPLEGKSPSQKEKILKAQAEAGLPLPEGRTASEKALIQKVKAATGERRKSKSRAIGAGTPALPPEKAKKLDEKTAKVMKEGKGPSDECICGLLTPESEKVSVGKVAALKSPSERLKAAKAAGLLTPLAGKSPEQREKILKGLAKQGVPLPEGKTVSEKKIIDKVRTDLGMPPEPKTPSMKEKYAKAQAQGIITPLEGKSASQKEKILKAQAEAGLPLPEGRTPSEKALINKVRAPTPAARIPSEKLRKAKAAGLLTPLAGKTPEQREKILKGLAKQGLPLPEAKTASEMNIIDKVRTDLGMPPEPKTPSIKEKYAKAQAQGIMTPLEGKSAAQKENILKAQAQAGIPLPEGRTPSEKALINKVKAALGAPSAARIPSEKLRKAKAAGLLTPLTGKSPEQKEKILKGLAKTGIPLPEGKTASEKKLIDKVRADLGMPTDPKTPSMKEKYAKAQAQGIMTPLEGKSADQKEKILKAQAQAGIPLPEGRTPSEKALINKIKATVSPVPSRKVAASPSERLRKAKAAGLITPLEGKSPEQKEKILRGLAMQGVPLPEGKTASEKKLVDKVRNDVGLPPEPKVAAEKEKYKKALAAGIITPLEGKSPSQKEKILKAQAEAGLPLPEGRTASEKALIQKVKAATGERRKSKFRAIGAGTPALPPEKAKKLDEKTAKVMKEGKGPSDECICGLLTPESEKVSVGKVAALKSPSERLKAAKAAGLLTPLAGKSPEQREKILKGLAKQGVPLPEGKTVSEKKIIDKVRTDLGMPPEPKTPSMKEKYAKAQAQGIMTPLEGKSAAQKENILKAQAQAGIPLPEGRTPSEKALINKVKAEAGAPSIARIPSEKLRKAKEAGLLTPLTGKSPEQREKILKGLAKAGITLPEGKTASEKKIIDKVRAELGMPPEPKTPSMKQKYAKALTQGIMSPLEGKTLAQKEKILKSQAEAGIPLPEGRTPSEKAMISKVRATTVPKIPSEKFREAKAAGLLTPLEGKTKDQKEKIIKGLVKAHLPLPEGKTPSEKEIIRKVTKEMGLPPEPKTPSVKERLQKAQAAGIITPLEGKTQAQKEKILKSMAQAGVPLPEGRTASEKALIKKTQADLGIKPSRKGPPTPLSKEAQELDKKTAKVLKEGKGPSDECICSVLTPESEKVSVKAGKPSIAKPAGKIPSEKLRKAKAAGLLTPLEGKTPAQKEKILKGLAMQGLPLPEGKTASEKKLINKLRNDLGVSPEPKSGSAKVKYDNAIADGLILPLEGKSPQEKEKILRAIADRGIALPEGRTKSEKALIAKVKAEPRGVPSERVPSEKLRKAKAAGLLTPLEGKSAAQKEKILKGLAEAGLPLPEGKSPSEKGLVQKVKTEYGIPKAVTPSEKEIVRKARAEGLFTPLAGKTAAQKEKTLKGLAEAGLPLPEGKTASEKQLIQKVRTAAGLPPEATPSEKLGKIRTKSKKVGAGASKRFSKGIGGSGIAKAGIVEEFQDILKTTTCDRGCGCDKKKIRFKHSYVKIRVTSPDISSLCPCPDECVPGVKGGVLVDNEGIKVTVGSAVGFPKFSIENENKISYIDDSSSATYSLETNPITLNEDSSISKMYFERDKAFKIAYKNKNMKANYSSESLSIFEGQHNIYKDNIDNYYVNELDFKSDRCNTSTSRYLIACSESFSSMNTLSRTSFPDKSSSNSLLIVRTESSLSFSSKSSAIRTISIISFHNSSIIARSSHYLCFECSTSATNISGEDSEHFTNVINYSTLDSLASDSKEEVIPDYKSPIKKNGNNDKLIYRVSHTNLSYNGRQRLRSTKDLRKPQDNKKHDPIIVINDLNSDQDILKIVSEVLAKTDIENSSSIFVVVPTSDEYDTDLTESVSSTLCIRVSENFFNWKNKSDVNSNQKRQSSKKSSVPQGLKIISRGKQFFLECTPSHSKDLNKLNQKHSTQTAFELSTQNKDCQVNNNTEMLNNRAERSRVVSMDTTQDRPCCCPPKELDSPNNFGSNDQFVANAFSEIMAPMILKQGAAQGLSQDAYLSVPRFNLDDFKTHFSLNQTTSVSICDVPPCSLSFPSCHGSNRSPQYSKRMQNNQYPDLSDLKQISPNNYPCKCSTETAGASAQPVMKNVHSVGCGPTICKDSSVPAPIIRTSQRIDDYPCSSCGRPTANGKEKKVKLPSMCPCEAHKPPVVSTAIGPNGHKTRTVGCQCCLCDTKKSKSSKKKSCLCSDDSNKRKKKKNVVCECPQVVEEEPALLENENYSFLQDEFYFDANANRKMKSDQTQTTSGFRINFKKRPPLAEEMSFEDALKYFEEHPEEGGSTQVDDSCFCDENGVPLDVTGVPASVDNPDVDCECPYEEGSNGAAGEAGGSMPEELPGLKLHIGGKGSGSKGLSGICCFDMIQESNGLLLLHD